MTKKEKKRLEALFGQEVQPHAKVIDPGDEEDWHSLTIGWALAKGVPPKDAVEFATYLRYETDLA